MKIAIFYQGTESQLAKNLEAIISMYECSVAAYQTEHIWNAEICNKPAQLLKGATHVLFIYSRKPTTDSVFLFFFGMAVGKNIPVIILEQNKPIVLPRNCKRHATILTIDAFEDYFIKEQNSFIAIEVKRSAKKELLMRGYPCFENNFIDAVINGNNEIIELFLRAGFDPSLKDTRGTPLLSLAIRESQYETAAILISHGAKVNLCAEDRSYSPLMEAAQLGDIKTAQILLARHADTNIQSKDGQTALILAVGRQDIPMVKILAEYHADWNISDSLGMSALGYAKLFRNQAILTIAGM
ncbi:MAG: ankyrin repeat domain-containing protein [Treponema sp.]